jgi:hypothetical protein
LVSALARGALAMCAMWVGFLSSFFAGERKKQYEYPLLYLINSFFSYLCFYKNNSNESIELQ